MPFCLKAILAQARCFHQHEPFRQCNRMVRWSALLLRVLIWTGWFRARPPSASRQPFENMHSSEVVITFFHDSGPSPRATLVAKDLILHREAVPILASGPLCHCGYFSPPRVHRMCSVEHQCGNGEETDVPPRVHRRCSVEHQCGSGEETDAPPGVHRMCSVEHQSCGGASS